MDRAFEEQAEACSAAQAMRHAIPDAHPHRALTLLPEGDNRILQSLWIGETLTTLEHLAVKSWLAHGHQVRRVALNPKL